jgi:hypothetical protein
MADNTSALIESLTNTVNELIPCYYEEAPGGAIFPYAILTGINGYDIGAGDGVAFTLEFYTGEQVGQSQELDADIDKVRAALDSACVRATGSFAAHIGFNSRSGMDENSYDLCRRRLNFTARTFFAGGN